MKTREEHLEAELRRAREFYGEPIDEDPDLHFPRAGESAAQFHQRTQGGEDVGSRTIGTGRHTRAAWEEALGKLRPGSTVNCYYDAPTETSGAIATIVCGACAAELELLPHTPLREAQRFLAEHAECDFPIDDQ